MTESTPWAFQHIRAQNDINGNPRRLYLVHGHDGQTLRAIDEGYAGIGAISETYKWTIRDVRDKLIELCPINVPVSEYRSLLRNFEKERPR